MKQTNDGYIMLLDAVYFGGKKIGNIAEDGVDWGGDNAEYIKLYAAQVRNSPVKKIRKKAASNVLKFNLIELLPDNCVAVMGGTVMEDGWEAPSESVVLEGAVKIISGTGQTVEIAKASLEGMVRGKLGGDDPLHIECELEVLTSGDDSAPFKIVETKPFIEANPTEITFKKAGETKVVDISASGAFSMSAAPAGFTSEAKGGRVLITAANNTGAQRTGKITFQLKADSSKKVDVNLTQQG